MSNLPDLSECLRVPAALETQVEAIGDQGELVTYRRTGRGRKIVGRVFNQGRAVLLRVAWAALAAAQVKVEFFRREEWVVD